MSNEVPEISFKEMLLVPEGPPAAVWERALEAAFAAPQQDDGPDGASPAVAAAGAGTGTEPGMDADADTDPDGGDDPDVDGAPAYEFQPVPGPTFDGEEPAPADLSSEDEVPGDGDDVQY